MRATPPVCAQLLSDARTLRRSDLLGVALGTAALEIAKAGLGVEPSWWPADLLAIVLGCLLGVFLPVLVKYAGDVASGSPWLEFKYYGALGAITAVFLSVLFVGIPDDRQSDFPWTIGVSLGLVVAVLAFLVLVVLAIPLYNARSLTLKQQWAVLRTDNKYRQLSWYDKHDIRDEVYGSDQTAPLRQTARSRPFFDKMRLQKRPALLRALNRRRTVVEPDYERLEESDYTIPKPY